jgi:hypothetical protein
MKEEDGVETGILHLMTPLIVQQARNLLLTKISRGAVKKMQIAPPLAGLRHRVSWSAPAVRVLTSMPDDTPQSPRLLSLDAFRGFIMVCLICGGFGLAQRR